MQHILLQKINFPIFHSIFTYPFFIFLQIMIL